MGHSPSQLEPTPYMLPKWKQMYKNEKGLALCHLGGRQCVSFLLVQVH